ncbi:hypothetical protein PR202_ga30955 [Eleusine coracana subsp. coracana]|uniref:Longin domain-containing protein n=1 Tax=Eleusine coracana subsp. coracana TaxID=191504 RepID=A0AAV5DR35_ELECO|nr:hypothetical protein QOZ80_8AG0614680 [Eleusine coracana subsp. coracana]GJN12660.1 hypothetical protein PR202_ga30955 [Eleusine coracana subsp. coracana]
MNPRRSRSVKLVPARATKQQQHPLEVDVPIPAGADDDDPRMSSSAANTVYCCIARGRTVIYSYNSKDGDPAVESLAALCLEHAPSHHRHFVHTSGSRTFAFLNPAADGGHTFFAIIDPCVGSAGALQFLERVRDVFRTANNNSHRNGLHDSMLVPAVQRLVASLEKMPHAAFVLDDENDSSASTCTSSKVPLLGKSGSRNEKKKKSKDKAKKKNNVLSPGDGDDEQHAGTRGVRIDMPPTPAEGVGGGGMSLERSTSQARLRSRQQQPSRSLWMRHVKIIIVVDAVICLVLFAAWLAVCKGFQCVSG